MPDGTLRADLHLHSEASGLKQLRFMRMRDCYSPPIEVYRRAKARGMDLVTLTDHDTIDGCLEIRERLGDPPDFFMSEEVETFLPGGRSMHIGVFGITESQHREIQRLRRDFEGLVGYLEEQRIPASLNHLFRGHRPGMDMAAYLAPLVNRFDLIETRNGTQSGFYREQTRRAIETLRKGARPGETGGSDAHTLARVARTWTECPGNDRDSYLDNLRAGRGRTFGDDGRLLPLARDVYSVIFSYYATLFDRGRVRFGRGEKWPGVLFCLATLPSHLIAFPFLATAYNRLAKRLVLARVEEALDRIDRERGAVDDGGHVAGTVASAELVPEPES
jgi:predicted metal-dependent phosphoesterase TrpH